MRTTQIASRRIDAEKTFLRGEGAERQVPNKPEVAAVAAGGGNTCGCFLVTSVG